MCLTLRLHINRLKAAEIEGNKKLSRRQIDLIGKSRVKVWGNIKGGNNKFTLFIIHNM